MAILLGYLADDFSGATDFCKLSPMAGPGNAAARRWAHSEVSVQEPGSIDHRFALCNAILAVAVEVVRLAAARTAAARKPQLIGSR